MTDDAAVRQEIEEILGKYRSDCDNAIDTRDQSIRSLADQHGLRQVDVMRLLGCSRESARQIMRPEVRAAVRASRNKAADDSA